jgi:hypothetical protein
MPISSLLDLYLFRHGFSVSNCFYETSNTLVGMARTDEKRREQNLISLFLERYDSKNANLLNQAGELNLYILGF